MALFLAGIAVMPGNALAQTGTVYGEVTDAITGETLPGANVVIQGTTYGIATDIDGRYTLRRVPAGDHVLEIRYMGFSTQQIPITVVSGERVRQNIELEPVPLEGDEIFVIGYQRGQSRALTRQRESPNIRSVISSEQLDRMTTTSVSGALARVTGMHGGTNIRGVGSAASNITMDGQRMGTTGKGTRAVDLGTISVDMVSELDVIKVITPDMDADALAGVINISTRRPVGGERDFDVRLGGGANSRYFNQIGGNTRMAMSYGDSPTQKFSFALNASYQRSPSGREELLTNWATRVFDDDRGPVDVLNNLSTTLRFDHRDRYGTGLQMTFQPTDRTTFHVQGMFNYQEREEMRYWKQYNPSVDNYISPNETRHPRPVDRSGRMQTYSRLMDFEIHQYTFQAAARHLFDSFDLEYKLGWGHGRYFEDSYEFYFQTPSLYEFFVNMEDRLKPTVDLLMEDYPHDGRWEQRWVDNLFDRHIDNEFSGTIDLQVPYQWGSFKFGSSARMTFKDGDHETHRMEFDRPLRMNSYDMIQGASWHIFDRDFHHTYHHPQLLDLHSARDFYYAKYPHFDLNLERWGQETDTRSFEANENTFAAYGMGTLRFGRFRFLGGARVEHTYNRYDGREAIIDFDGNYRGSLPLSNTNTYTYLFPNAQMVYGLGARTNIRIAYSRSIGRPTFAQLSPYRLINYSNQTIRRGNPDLKPMISDNFDLMFEHYFMGVGEFTIGFYYKELADFVYLFERRRPSPLEPGEGEPEQPVDEFAGWDERTFLNGEEANVYGVEVSWQQSLRFLPGFLGNLSTFANYTWSQSTAHMDRRKAPLTGQIPHIVNVGLDFQQGGFAMNLFYQWSSDVLVGYGAQRWVPEIQLQERVYFDRYSYGRNDLSATLRYRITSNMRMWLDLNNLLNNTTGEYFYDSDFYPRLTVMTGRSASLGLRYSL